MPCARGPNAVALGVDVEEVRPPVGDDALGAQDRGPDLAGLGNDFAFHPEGARSLGVVDVRTADVAGHVAPSLELTAAETPDAVALVVVAPVVEHDVHHRRL